MSTTVEIIGPTDTLTLYPAPDVNGWVYDNVTLDAWYAQADADATLDKRPNAHGTYAVDQMFLKEHRPIIRGQYYATDRVDALNARARLAAFYNDGRPVAIRVTDELGPTTRIATLVARDVPFRYDFTHLVFDLAFVATDPRRYGQTTSDIDGMPTASSGLVWNLGTSPSGLYFDWGTDGNLGRVSFTNTGQATTYPRIDVGGAGAFTSGFRITEIETGRELTFVRPTNLDDVITFDSRTQRATIANGGGDVTGGMTSRDWFEIPPGETRRYQINPLGGYTGTPTMTLYAAPASL